MSRYRNTAVGKNDVSNIGKCFWLPFGTIPPPAPSPRMQEKARRQICRIHVLPDIGGQPLPRRVFICPRSRTVRQASRQATRQTNGQGSGPRSDTYMR